MPTQFLKCVRRLGPLYLGSQVREFDAAPNGVQAGLLMQIFARPVVGVTGLRNELLSSGLCRLRDPVLRLRNPS
jgi:beta-phosphoglucomutase-like phosphatase (HAD superfamily)